MAELRISEEALECLRKLAGLEEISMNRLIDKALEEYQKKQFFDSLSATFDALKSNPESWAEEQKERAVWENTLSENLDPDEVWTDDGRCL